MDVDVDPQLARLVERVAETTAARFLRAPEPMVLPEFLTPTQAAALSGYTVKALEVMRAKREGPPYSKPDGRSVRYRVDELRAWLSQHRVERP